MLNRSSIATKVFGLAVLLLCLTIALAGFLLWHITGLQGKMNLIAQREVPLANSLSKLDEYGLRRRLAFERWFGALNALRPNAEVIKEAQANYDIFTEHLHREFATAKKLLDISVEGDRHRGKLGEVGAVLAQVEAAYPVISARQRRSIAGDVSCARIVGLRQWHLHAQFVRPMPHIRHVADAREQMADIVKLQRRR